MDSKESTTRNNGLAKWLRLLLMLLLIPLVLPAVVLVALPLGILALLSSIPYYALYPDRLRHVYDFEATPRQRELLVRWRTKYAQLGFRGRIKRYLLRRERRRRVPRQRIPAVVRRIQSHKLQGDIYFAWRPTTGLPNLSRRLRFRMT